MVFYNDETVTPTSSSTTGDEVNESGEQLSVSQTSSSAPMGNDISSDSHSGNGTENDSEINENNENESGTEDYASGSENNGNEDASNANANHTTSGGTRSGGGNTNVYSNGAGGSVCASARGSGNNGNGGVIYEVWQDNMGDAFDRISEIVDKYPFVAIDTEFPGVVVRPTNNFHEYYYQTVRFNVDLLKVIQIGLSFRDKYGRAPTGTYSTFQFNFKFDMENDIYSQESIQFLRHSGIEFDKHHNNGIDFLCFGEYMYGSGLILNPNVKWISFHGCYDFAYLVKILSSKPLPESESNFFETVKMLFPTLYDIKFILKQVQTLNHLNSLQKLSEHLEIQRIGIAHQAGSDALVTCCTFFKLIRNYLDSCIDDNLFNGQIYGFGNSASTSK